MNPAMQLNLILLKIKLGDEIILWACFASYTGTFFTMESGGQRVSQCLTCNLEVAGLSS